MMAAMVPEQRLNGRPADDSMTLDELAEISGVPARTIRFYRQSGLIDAPERVGRQAYYSGEHLARLRVVAGLRAKGLALDAIASVLDDPEGSRESFGPLLQIGEELRHPWVEDREAVMKSDEVLAVFGVDDPSYVELLEHYQVISHVPGSRPRRYVVPSVGALELAGRLNAMGVHPDLINNAWIVMHGQLAQLARDLIAIFAAHPNESFAGWPAPDRVGETFAELQAVALRAMQLAFAREMQAALDAFVEQGGVFEADRRAATEH
jgi:DNA-binding transcriptional MerR regulator